MSASGITRDEAQRRFDLVTQALRRGMTRAGSNSSQDPHRGGALAAAAAADNKPIGSRQTWLKSAEKILGAYPWPEDDRPSGPRVLDEIPDPDPTYEQIKARAISDFGKKAAHRDAVRLVQVSVPVEGAFGVMVMGDPHVDDAGTDWPMLAADTALVLRTPGLFAANVGDLTNNWVGRLGRLYGEQNMGRRRALIVAEGFIKELAGKWLWIDSGNHDLWSGHDDPLLWIARQSAAIYRWYGNRLKLVPPRGEGIIVNSRHDHPGWSMWNPTHGPLKAAQMDGLHDDLYTCGHLHIGGYQIFAQPGGKLSHLFRASGYKTIDAYAEAKGLRDQHLPRGIFIVRPEAPLRDRLTFYHDTGMAADILGFLRRAPAAAVVEPAGRRRRR